MADPLSLLPSLLSQCMVGLPVMIVWVVGIAFLGARIGSHRTAASLGIGGIVLALITSLIHAIVFAILPVFYQDLGVSSIGIVYSAVGIVGAILNAIAWGLVVSGFVMALGRPEPREGLPPRD